VLSMGFRIQNYHIRNLGYFMRSVIGVANFVSTTDIFMSNRSLARSISFFETFSNSPT